MNDMPVLFFRPDCQHYPLCGCDAACDAADADRARRLAARATILFVIAAAIAGLVLLATLSERLPHAS